MNMEMMETDLQDAQLRHPTAIEYQIMDPSLDSQGTILKAKNDFFVIDEHFQKSLKSCLSLGDRVYDNYSMLKEISGSNGSARDAEMYAAYYCKNIYKDTCDIIVKIVRNDQYAGSF